VGEHTLVVVLEQHRLCLGAHQLGLDLSGGFVGSD
jgi:hypothetical protein